MSKYFENNLNEGEEIEIEIEHSRLIIVQMILKFAMWLIVAVVLNLLENRLIKFLNGLPDDVSDLNWIFIVVRVLIWGAFVLMGILIPIEKLIVIFSTKLAITNRRIIGKSGFFSTAALDYPIEKVDSVLVNVSFFGKILHYSEIVIKSTNDDKGILFDGVTNANEFRNKLTAAIARNQDEARKAQANEIATAMKNSNT